MAKGATPGKPYLDASNDIWHIGIMSEMRKITVFLPAELLDDCQRITGKGVSETLRIALRDLVHHHARHQLMAAMGHLDLEADGLTLETLRDEGGSDRAHHAA